MSIAREDLLPTNSYFKPGSREWRADLFRRAYCEQGSFQRVRQRLNAHASVLVYLPGSCITAAADVLATDADFPLQYGTCFRPGSTHVSTMWQTDGAELLGRVVDWSSNPKDLRAIVHNLDLLADGRGGLDSSLDAKTMLLALLEATRVGVVLGLADRDAGPLPEVIRRAFPEEIWIDEIPLESFHRLIPQKLGDQLKSATGLTKATVSRLHARLRWSDPIRASRILSAVRNHGDLASVLAGIAEITRSVEFLPPDEDTQHTRPEGVAAEVLDVIERNVIHPFESWLDSELAEKDSEVARNRLPPGLILFGPPGTGKTYLARWISNRIRLPVRLVTAAQIKTSAYGDAERNVRELFRAARRAAPCVIVLDDADDLLPDRNKVDGAVASAERGIVNTFLQELEGWRGRPEGVFVILTTNRFENHLDEAAKSRLALHVRVPYPCTREETAALVSTFAKEYGYDLTDIEKPLVERFCAAVIPDAETDASTADGRRLAKANLFGPREIRGGMRFLLGESGTAGPYRPNLDDLKRMNDYYAHLPRSFDGEPRS